jgi:hypothetical protein
MPGYSDCSFADSLWSAMDEAICLPECDVYSYKSDGEDDPFGAFIPPSGVAACNHKFVHCASNSLGQQSDRLSELRTYTTQARLATSGPSTTSCTTASRNACCTFPVAASPKPQVHPVSHCLSCRSCCSGRWLQKLSRLRATVFELSPASCFMCSVRRVVRLRIQVG